MIYRYRLKECEENKGFTSRKVRGTTLYKKRWLYKDSPLNIENLEKIVEFEKAESEEDFQQKDRQRKANKERAEREYGKAKEERRQEKAELSQNPQSIDNDRVTYMKKDIYSMNKDELYDHALERGFTTIEIRGLRKEYLVELLEIEEEIG